MYTVIRVLDLLGESAAGIAMLSWPLGRSDRAMSVLASFSKPSCCNGSCKPRLRQRDCFRLTAWPLAKSARAECSTDSEIILYRVAAGKCPLVITSTGAKNLRSPDALALLRGRSAKVRSVRELHCTLSLVDMLASFVAEMSGPLELDDETKAR